MEALQPVQGPQHQQMPPVMEALQPVQGPQHQQMPPVMEALRPVQGPQHQEMPPVMEALQPVQGPQHQQMPPAMEALQPVKGPNISKCLPLWRLPRPYQGLIEWVSCERHPLSPSGFQLHFEFTLQWTHAVHREDYLSPPVDLGWRFHMCCMDIEGERLMRRTRSCACAGYQRRRSMR